MKRLKSNKVCLKEVTSKHEAQSTFQAITVLQYSQAILLSSIGMSASMLAFIFEMMKTKFATGISSKFKVIRRNLKKFISKSVNKTYVWFVEKLCHYYLVIKF